MSSSTEAIVPSDPSGSTVPPKPRVGGITADGEAWVGGSNLNPLTTYIHVGQRRPSKHSSAALVEASCKKGIDYKLGRTDAESDCSVILWMNLLFQNLEEKGMNNVVRALDGTTEVKRFKDYGKAPSPLFNPGLKH